MSKTTYNYNPKPCETCLREFTPNNSSHVHCSNKCLQKSLRGKYLLRNYGISLDEYNDLFNKQEGVCAICGREGDKLNSYAEHSLMVDHIHDENKTIRGLLCANCNRGLGLFQDSRELLSKAANYLNNHANINPTFVRWRSRNKVK